MGKILHPVEQKSVENVNIGIEQTRTSLPIEVPLLVWDPGS